MPAACAPRLGPRPRHAELPRGGGAVMPMSRAAAAMYRFAIRFGCSLPSAAEQTISRSDLNL